MTSTETTGATTTGTGGVLGDSRRSQRILWATIGLLTLAAAAVGLVQPSIYVGLMPDALLPGIYGQDAVSAVVGAALVASAIPQGRGPRLDLIALGLVGYLAYAYGILVIERAYTPLYLVYLAVFAGSAWTLVLAVAGARVALARGMRPPVLPRWAAVVSTVGALLQPAVFVPLWVLALVPLMAERRRIDSLYSVYILDLGFVMPAFVVAAVLLILRRRSGTLLAPPMFVLGAVLIGSLAVSALVGPLFGVPVAPAQLAPSAVLSILFIVLAGIALLTLRSAPSSSFRPTAPTLGTSIPAVR